MPISTYRRGVLDGFVIVSQMLDELRGNAASQRNLELVNLFNELAHGKHNGLYSIADLTQAVLRGENPYAVLDQSLDARQFDPAAINDLPPESPPSDVSPRRR